MDRDVAFSDAELLRAFRAAVRATVERELENERRDAEARRARVLPEVLRAVTECRSRGLCGRAWLFGSYAWGNPNERSDVDLLVEDCDDAVRMASTVMSACGLLCHVVEREAAPPTLVERALQEGVAL